MNIYILNQFEYFAKNVIITNIYFLVTLEKCYLKVK